MTHRDLVFELGPTGESNQLVDELQRRFPGRADAGRTTRRTYFDTFDWRLHRAAGSLSLETSAAEPRVTWAPNHGARPVREALASVPEFVCDFPEGRLRECLGEIVEVRRLEALVEIEGCTVVHHVLDEEEKTVVRAEVCSRRVRPPAGVWKPLSTTVTVHGLTGYDAEREGLVRFLKYRAGLPVTERSELEQALAGLGRQAGGDPSRFEVEFPADATAGQAVRAVLRALLRTLQRNEAGVLARLDPEYLHDFRIAVRRTRAVLGQLGQVFPRPVLDHYWTEFRWLGGLTSRLRDLDVFAIELPAYESELPPPAREDLGPLKEHVRVSGEREHQVVSAALESERYARLLRNWGEFLEKPDAPSPELAHEDALDVVGKATWKRFKKVLRRGAQVAPDSDGAALHALRIECKKLRYLLELFGGLFDADEVHSAVRELKRLQRVLGTVNDLEVHGAMLEELLAELTQGDLAPARLARSIGRLEEVLERRRRRGREKFGARFERFSRDSNRKTYRHAFRPS